MRFNQDCCFACLQAANTMEKLWDKIQFCAEFILTEIRLKWGEDAWWRTEGSLFVMIYAGDDGKRRPLYQFWKTRTHTVPSEALINTLQCASISRFCDQGHSIAIRCQEFLKLLFPALKIPQKYLITTIKWRRRICELFFFIVNSRSTETS